MLLRLQLLPRCRSLDLSCVIDELQLIQFLLPCPQLKAVELLKQADVVVYDDLATQAGAFAGKIYCSE